MIHVPNSTSGTLAMVHDALRSFTKFFTGAQIFIQVAFPTRSCCEGYRTDVLDRVYDGGRVFWVVGACSQRL